MVLGGNKKEERKLMITDVNKLIGLPHKEAKNFCKKCGAELRVMLKDGVPFAGTCDVKCNRINVAVDQDKITKIMGVG